MTTNPQERGRGSTATGLLQRHGALIALVALAAYCAWAKENFLSWGNLTNVLRQASTAGIIAVGMTFVISLGGIDLSVGSAVAFIGGVGVLTLNRCMTWNPEGETIAVAAAHAVCLLLGPALGLLTGLLITKGRLAPFIATLGGMAAYRSAALSLADGGEYRSATRAFEFLGAGELALPLLSDAGGDPVRVGYPVLAWAAMVVVGLLLLNRSRYGRYVLSIGANEQAAIYSGVPVERVKAATYTLCGACCGLAALLNASRLNSVSSSGTGTLLELDAIAAVVIGGTRMEGGRGMILGTVVGVLLLAVINNVLNFTNVSPYLHGLIKGGIIVAAVLAQRERR